MEVSKTKKRFRLFQCFRPDVLHDDGDVVSPRKKGVVVDPPLTYIVVPDKQGVVLPLPSAFTASKSVSSRDDNPSRRKKNVKENNNSFRRALMAALSHTSFAKKMSNKKNKKHNDGFSRESSINLTNTTTNSSTPSSFGFTSSISSSTSTTLSSTSTGINASGSPSEPSLSKSLATNGTVVAQEKRNIGDSEKRCFGNSNIAVSFLFISSLLVLIMWGKCCAIAFTSIGFFLVPNRRRRICKEEAICEESEHES